VLPAVSNHRADGFEGLFARHVQFDLQVQVGGSEKDVQTGRSCRGQCFHSCIDVGFFGSRQSGDRHVADFSRHCLYRFQVAA
jgi:hypothetical protein